MNTKGAVIGLFVAIVCAVAFTALKPLSGVRSFAQTIQPVVVDAGALAQAEACGAVIDAGEDAGGCCEDAGCYDANGIKAGSANQIVSDDGYNSLLCCNLSSSILYFGHSAVTSANGLPVCTSTTNCSGSCFSLDTNQGQIYATAAARADGGYPIRCVAGH